MQSSRRIIIKYGRVVKDDYDHTTLVRTLNHVDNLLSISNYINNLYSYLLFL